MAHPLESAHLKLTRAVEHLTQLDVEAALFVNTQPYIVIPEWNFDAPEHTLRVRTPANPPARLGVIAGDVIHNIRASLDHLIYELAGIGTEDTRGERTQWPVTDTPKLFDDRAGIYLKGVDAVHRATIKKAQPFEPGFHLFTAMALLDDRDKHRTIQPLAAWAVNARLRTDPPDAITDLRLPRETVYLDDNAVLGWFKAKEKVSVDYDLGYTIQFGSRDGPKLSVPELRALIGIASYLLGQFVGAFDPPT